MGPEPHSDPALRFGVRMDQAMGGGSSIGPYLTVSVPFIPAAE
jgi:hypothetical protein